MSEPRRCPDCSSLIFVTDQNCAQIPTAYCNDPDCDWFGEPTSNELDAMKGALITIEELEEHMKP